MIEAGSETTSQALNNTMVGLLSNPDAVMKAHEELDRVVGDRPPTFEDEKDLPYIRAIVKVTHAHPRLIAGSSAMASCEQTGPEPLRHSG